MIQQHNEKRLTSHLCSFEIDTHTGAEEVFAATVCFALFMPLEWSCWIWPQWGRSRHIFLPLASNLRGHSSSSDWTAALATPRLRSHNVSPPCSGQGGQPMAVISLGTKTEPNLKGFLQSQKSLQTPEKERERNMERKQKISLNQKCQECRDLEWWWQGETPEPLVLIRSLVGGHDKGAAVGVSSLESLFCAQWGLRWPFS